MKETQYDIIKKLHRAKEWVCANEYRNHYIPYFWKRQAEMKNCKFIHKPCEHGTPRGFDYKMIEQLEIPIVGEVKEERIRFYRPDWLEKQKELRTKLL